ncbi:acyl-CoA thioesterase [Pajaroellobacter abortibovis]|uniref:Thioesterase domain-containing protein n=1 Tax=Pajaroellobacter abortibovis TaxID=1882918 RepID=A0A1L6MWV9_9BACT|nr:thioesterase family protein [Pajaroellobacter abortibovis]APR99944.1 hypothetical protein BCY86_04050 [Pajaroellobacter abortibovis]
MQFKARTHSSKPLIAKEHIDNPGLSSVSTETEWIFKTERSVRFQDVDAAGIVFFARFFEYFHDAYMEWIGHQSPLSFHSAHPQTFLFPLVHARADYHLPLRFGDRLRVEITSVFLGKTSFTLAYRICKQGAFYQKAASGSTVHVCLDIIHHRPSPLPPSIRTWLTDKTE